MNLEHALKIEGWLTEAEAEALGKMASEASLIAELGSWLGRSTVAMAANALGHVYAVDTWQGSAEHQDILCGKPQDWLYGEFLRNTKDYPIFPLRMDSLRAAEFFRILGVKFDLIFLDASHDYESVKADILFWEPLLTSSGTLAGHDYDTIGEWTGVVQAVDELCPEREIISGTSLWRVS